MAAGGALTEIDWSRPWFAPIRGRGETAWDAVRAGATVAAALNAAGAAPVRFVPQSVLQQGEAYESHVLRTGEVPTRDNLHDFFNGLCWLLHPQLKQQLNRVQAAEIATAGIGPVRGPVRDAVTLLDENGAFLEAPDPLFEALLARDWRAAFLDLREAWKESRVVIFGHALLEQLVKPRKELTAHVWKIRGLPEAAAVTRETLAAKPFTPLPLMGIPGWCAGNANFSFYDDSSVFRPARGRLP